MSRKLYTSYMSSESNVPFLVSFDGQSNLQAYANNEDKYKDTEYIRVTDENGNNVKAVIPNTDSKAHQLVIRLNEGDAGDLCYVEDDGAVSSTSIQVLNIPTLESYSLTVNVTNPELTDVTINITNHSDINVESSTGKTLTVNNIPEGTELYISVYTSGYESYSGTVSILNQNETIQVSLETLVTLELAALDSQYRLERDATNLSRAYLIDTVTGQNVKCSKGTDVFVNTNSSYFDLSTDISGSIRNVYRGSDSSMIYYNPFTAELQYLNAPHDSVSCARSENISVNVNKSNIGTITDSQANFELTISTIAHTAAIEGNEITTMAYTGGDYLFIGNMDAGYQCTITDGEYLTLSDPSLTTVNHTVVYEITSAV